MTDTSISILHRLACRVVGCDAGDPRRTSRNTLSRAITSEIAREEGASTPQIGRVLGRDHSTVIHYRAMLDDMRAWPSLYAEPLRKLEQTRTQYHAIH